MATMVNLDDLGGEFLTRLMEEAQRRGKDVESVVKDLVREGLPAGAFPRKPSDDFAKLAGTWTDAEADAFLSHLADQRHIDSELWP